MTEILLDTSIIIDVLEGLADEQSKNFLERHRLSISIISYFEVLKFAYKIGKSRDLWIVKDRLQSYHPLPLTPEICEKASQMAHSENISMADALIYSTAQINGLRLVTSDSDLGGKPGVMFVKPQK